eukprot:TRINITY_DN92303_c0_g1_i1.p1 TRINITY_DN92303_c0_g1~~TRINITY_DN92303_c0_g1_i1.p1  ORF type:complete len:334 (-),score=63.17 TRINITY_DN92303_c0_g1_i1:23-979(-)
MAFPGDGTPPAPRSQALVSIFTPPPRQQQSVAITPPPVVREQKREQQTANYKISVPAAADADGCLDCFAFVGKQSLRKKTPALERGQHEQAQRSGISLPATAPAGLDACLDCFAFVGTASPFCAYRDLVRFAAICRTASEAFAGESAWRPWLGSAHAQLLKELSLVPEGISSCRELSIALEASRTAAKALPILQKPSNAMTAWQLPEHVSWKKGLERWHSLCQKRVVQLHMGSSKEAAAEVAAGLEEQEADLEALHQLARCPNGLGDSTDVRNSEAVRRALDRHQQRRRCAIQQTAQWLSDDLAGPLLGDPARRFQYT